MKCVVCFWLVLVAVLHASFAAAQTTPTEQGPFFGSEASPDLPEGALPQLAAPNLSDETVPWPPGFGGDDGLYRILIVGDGLAGGLGAGLTRMTENDPAIEIVNRFNESTGLARPELYDWALAVPKILETRPFDAAVILLGVNDRQAIREAGVRHEFGSAPWLKLYTQRLETLLATLKLANVTVYWVGLPPMGNPEFDKDMQFLASLHSAAVARMGGHFLATRSYFIGADGQYTDRGPDETGLVRRLRERDGISFLRAGNNRFGQIILGLIRGIVTSATTPAAVAAKPSDTPGVEAVTGQAAAAAPGEVPQQVATAPRPVPGPIFGQTGLSGEDLTFSSDTVVQTRPQQQVAVVPPIEKPKAPVVVKFDASLLVAKPGSDAERLFKTGLAAPAPLGRFDDFSVTPDP